MENRVREKIFALYSHAPKIKAVPYSELFDAEGLDVRSLESLDENDLHHITELLSETDAGNMLDKKEEVINMFEPGSSHFWDIGYTPFIYLQIADFLRGRGFALPAFGYTIDQLVDLKVFRLSKAQISTTKQMSFGTPIDGAPAEDNSLKKKGNKSSGLSNILKKNKS